MLRIDPAHPPVWRSPTVLQFGGEAVAVIEDPQPWQLRVVRELENGIPDGAYVPFAAALGAPSPDAATRLLARIRRALARQASPRRLVTLWAADDVPDAHRDAVGTGLTAAGIDIDPAPAYAGVQAAHRDAVAVVLVVHRVVPPAVAAALMSHDLVHVPVTLTGSGGEVGPVVAPGSTACLSCVAAHRRDRDPSWPAVAAQLLGRGVDADLSVAWEAGLVAGRLISEREGRPSTSRSRSVTLRAGSLHRSVREHRPHAECRCRSLAGSATAGAPVRLETTSERAFARPA